MADEPAEVVEELVYLVHDSGNDGSAGWYPAAAAAVLLRESALEDGMASGWRRGDPATGEALVDEQPADDAGDAQADDSAGDAAAEQTDGPPPADPKRARRNAGEPKE